MPNWPGGDCPSCGEWMPQNQVRCRNCRTLLNEDLKPDSVEIPEFVPLQEVDSMVEVSPSGYYILCPHCDKETEYNGNEFRPFCSERCKLLDFGAWADEEYNLPAETGELTDEDIDAIEKARKGQ